MGKTADEVRVAVDGLVAIGATTLTAPTSASSNLPTGWTDLGFISEDGVTESLSQDTQKLKAWQKGQTVRTLVTDGEASFKLVLLQTSAESIALYYGGTVGTDGSIVSDPTAERPRHAFVLDVIDGDSRIRKYIPQGQVTEVGDLVYKGTEAVGYEVTITAHYSDAISGSVKHMYADLATPAP